MKLVFVRHTSVAVEKGICYGQTDVPLAESFPEEAESVRERLKGMQFDAVYTSPLSRCVRLADFCGYPDALRDSRLMEMNFGEWEMKRYDEISDPRLQEWYADYMRVAATGGESAESQRRRFEDFLRSMSQRHSSDTSIAVFTHGGILIHAMAILGGISYEDAFASSPGYGAVLQFDC